MQPILQYLHVLRRQWVAFLTGSLPVALYGALSLAFPDDGKVRYPWNNLPPWVAWSFSIGSLVLAQYLVWHDLQKRHIELLEEQDNLLSKIAELEKQIDRHQETLTEIPTNPRLSFPKDEEKIIKGYPQLEISVSSEDRPWRDASEVHEMLALYVKVRFIIFHVRNMTTRNLSGIVARCRSEDYDIRCTWSNESGDRFVPGGRHTADLNAGDSRLLKIAQAMHTSQNVWFLSRASGEILQLNQEIDIELIFTAEDLYEVYMSTLGFYGATDPIFSMASLESTAFKKYLNTFIDGTSARQF